MHKLTLGIEHLFTGVTIQSRSEYASIRFMKESPSVVAAVSTQPMIAYWPVTQGWIESVEMTEEEEKKDNPLVYGKGAAEYYALKVAPRMREGDLAEVEPMAYRRARAQYPEEKLKPIPEVVNIALMNRFGKDAANVKHGMIWDLLNGCWTAEWQGMTLEIEMDGYIHS